MCLLFAVICLKKAAAVMLPAVQVERISDRFAEDVPFEQDCRHMSVIRDVPVCTSLPQISEGNGSNGRDVTVVRRSHNERQFRIHRTRKVTQMSALVPVS